MEGERGGRRAVGGGRRLWEAAGLYCPVEWPHTGLRLCGSDHGDLLRELTGITAMG